MRVFYVSSAIPGSVNDDPASVHRALIEQATTGQPIRRQMKRTEIAKFFEREHAEAHVAMLPPGHLDVEIEEREETREEQHEAHRDVVQKPRVLRYVGEPMIVKRETPDAAPVPMAPPVEIDITNAVPDGPFEFNASEAVAELVPVTTGDKSEEVQTLVDEAAKPR